MAAPASGTVTGASAFVAIMASMPFGVSFQTLFLGGACFFAGSCARTGMNLYKKLYGPTDVSLKDFLREIAALLCTTPLAAAASCIVFLSAHAAKIEADAAFGGLLLIAGVRGVEGFQWLTGIFSSVLDRFLPQRPDTQAQAKPADPKP